MKTEKNYFQVLYNILTVIIVGGISILICLPFNEKMDLGRTNVMILLFGEIFVLSNAAQHFYDVTLFVYLDRHLKIITKSYAVSLVSIVFILLLLKQPRELVLFMLVYVVLLYIVIVIGLVPGIWIQQMMRQKKAARTAFVGSFYEFQKANYYINKNSVKINQRGYILMDEKDNDGTFHVLGLISDLEDIIQKHKLEIIYFIQRVENNQKQIEPASELQPYINTCKKYGVVAKILIDSDALAFSGNISAIGTYPEITITPDNHLQ